MKHNRDISIILLNALDRKNIQIADPLAGSGIRSIRFIKELEKGMIKNLSINDYGEQEVTAIKKNIKLNNIDPDNTINIFCLDANDFLLKSDGFDYIDIDPFGSPNPFIDSATKRISRNGILAVTATDTPALCGNHPKACLRKYWANQINNDIMHETGLRILIRKIQLIGAQYKKALVPIFAYSKDHYMQVFFRSIKSKTRCDQILKQHNCLENVGPMWLGPLWDVELVKKMSLLVQSSNYDQKLKNFLAIVNSESDINTVGFYNFKYFWKWNRIRMNFPKRHHIISLIQQKGYTASPTHFVEAGIRSNIGKSDFLKIISEIS